MSKILLTGSHGFIGTHLRSVLQDHEVICYDLKIGKDLFFIQLKDLEGVDTIIHLAARISVPESWKAPHEYMVNNTLSTIHLAELAVQAGVKKFILASSSSVYGNPMSPYGSSKMLSELYLQKKEVLNSYLLRFFNVYGEGQNREYSGVITLFLEALTNNTPLKVYGDGEQKRDFVFVEDLAQILKFFCETDKRLHGAIDIGKGHSNSVNELIALLFRITGKSVAIKHEPERQEIKDSLANSIGLKSVLPDFKFTTLEEGLKKLCK